VAVWPEGQGQARMHCLPCRLTQPAQSRAYGRMCLNDQRETDRSLTTAATRTPIVQDVRNGFKDSHRSKDAGASIL
jgi:hypothetical protein